MKEKRRGEAQLEGDSLATKQKRGISLVGIRPAGAKHNGAPRDVQTPRILQTRLGADSQAILF